MPQDNDESTPSERPTGRSVSNATLSNVGAERAPIIDPEDIDDFEGTSSGMGLRGKPHRGSRERQDY